jgi:hypothetical protein
LEPQMNADERKWSLRISVHLRLFAVPNSCLS